MLRSDDAPKKGASLVAGNKAFEMDRRRYWEKWNENNKQGIAAYNARIAKEGLPLVKYRTS